MEHGEVIAAVIAAPRPYVVSRTLGRVFAPQTTYHLPGLPDREPDVSLISAGNGSPKTQMSIPACRRTSP